jgi:amino-acid N-acetyltransferase
MRILSFIVIMMTGLGLMLPGIYLATLGGSFYYMVTGALVLLSPFGFSPTGEAFNLTMEDVATATAIALQADKLLFMTEIPGIAEDRDDPDSAIDTELALADAQRLLSQLPPPVQPTDLAFYLQHCVKACAAGVSRACRRITKSYRSLCSGTKSS